MMYRYVVPEKEQTYLRALALENWDNWNNVSSLIVDKESMKPLRLILRFSRLEQMLFGVSTPPVRWYEADCKKLVPLFLKFYLQSGERNKNTATPILWPFVRDFPGEPVPEGECKLDLLKQETVSGSGISWVICKSVSCSRQIPSIPPLSFYRATPC